MKQASYGSRRLEEIDALRGIAARGVAFVFHIHHVLGRARTGPLDGLPVFSWLHDYGYVLVDLFFVVSGYIFAHVNLVDGRFKGTVRDFAAARFARVTDHNPLLRRRNRCNAVGFGRHHCA